LSANDKDSRLPPRVSLAAKSLKEICRTYGVEDPSGDGLADTTSKPHADGPRKARKPPNEAEIVAHAQGAVTWVDAWYALNRKHVKSKVSKDMCEISPNRLHCPARLDQLLRPVDDAIIKWSQCCVRQKRLRKPFMYLAYFFTCTTIVEIGPVLPIVLYGCFLDDLALVSLLVVAAVVLISQIPKRYCWRYRPFLDYRAVRLKANKTSSFPSRAVVCAVAYSYIAALCVLNGPGYFHPTVRGRTTSTCWRV
jgi:hypothetical protein